MYHFKFLDLISEQVLSRDRDKELKFTTVSKRIHSRNHVVKIICSRLNHEDLKYMLTF